MNLRQYAAQKNVKPSNVDLNRPPLNENEPNQKNQRQTRSGRKLPDLNLSSSPRTKTRPNLTNDQQNLPSLSPHDNLTLPHQSVQNTPTVSSIANQWKNLENPFSYSGNTATILDQIKSFS